MASANSKSVTGECGAQTGSRSREGVSVNLLSILIKKRGGAKVEDRQRDRQPVADYPLGRVGSCLKPGMVWRPVFCESWIYQTLNQSL